MDKTEKDNKRETALRRWKHLGQMLAGRKCRVQSQEGNSVSVRRFASFGLLKTKLLHDEGDATDATPESQLQIIKRNLWYEYSCDIAEVIYTAKIRYLDGSISIQTLLGFNNTGNVCVWPSEEVLTYFCLQRLSHFEGKAVCELGGGMTCLAGVFLGVYGSPKELLLTDGNEQSVENIDAIIKKNQSSFGDTKVHSKVLRWDDQEHLKSLEGHFDTIICADCLFFDEVSKDLVNTIHTLLKPQGEAIIFAPTRGETFMKFKDMALRKFAVTYTKQYDKTVLDLHNENLQKGIEAYDESLHYPLLLQLRKPEADSSDED